MISTALHESHAFRSNVSSRSTFHHTSNPALARVVISAARDSHATCRNPNRRLGLHPCWSPPFSSTSVGERLNTALCSTVLHSCLPHTCSIARRPHVVRSPRPAPKAESIRACSGRSRGRWTPRPKASPKRSTYQPTPSGMQLAVPSRPSTARPPRSCSCGLPSFLSSGMRWRSGRKWTPWRGSMQASMCTARCCAGSHRLLHG